MNHLFLSQGSDDESYVSDVSDNISEDNASVTDNISRQSRSQWEAAPHLHLFIQNKKEEFTYTHSLTPAGLQQCC